MWLITFDPIWTLLLLNERGYRSVISFNLFRLEPSRFKFAMSNISNSSNQVVNKSDQYNQNDLTDQIEEHFESAFTTPVLTTLMFLCTVGTISSIRSIYHIIASLKLRKSLHIVVFSDAIISLAGFLLLDIFIVGAINESVEGSNPAGCWLLPIGILIPNFFGSACTFQLSFLRSTIVKSRIPLPVQEEKNMPRTMIFLGLIFIYECGILLLPRLFDNPPGLVEQVLINYCRMSFIEMNPKIQNIFDLELRQYKNRFVSVKCMLVLKLPPFFPCRVGEGKRR